jgi:hypothetical protein
MSILELTEKQKQAIRQAYFEPAGTVRLIVDRIKDTGVPVYKATSWLWAAGYINYNDKLMLDGMA